MENLLARLVPAAVRVASIDALEGGARGSASSRSGLRCQISEPDIDSGNKPDSSTRWLSNLTDAELQSAMKDAAELCRVSQAVSALLAGEVARRSRPELGYAGLAQSSGHRTPELMVQSITGAPYREAAQLVSIGTMVAASDAESTGRTTDAGQASNATQNTDSGLSRTDEGASQAADSRWLAVITTGIRSGGLSVQAADAIRRGLGKPSEGITSDALAAAAEVLVSECPHIGADNLYRRARQLRDQLDASGVSEREENRRQQRYLRVGPEVDGMRHIHGLLDPESAAVIVSALDAVSSPRRGGPRFVDAQDKARAAAIIADPRTTEQLTLDALVEMVRVAIDADQGALFGAHRPAVQMVVTAADLKTGNGYGVIEGQPDAVSLDTVHRAICDTGIIPITIENGQPLDVGTQQRLFTRRQRIALAARDGGCVFPGCDRPPSWCEAHHIVHWKDGGPTNTRDGVLLCRHHHMLMHNNGWRITRTKTGVVAQYFLVPPRGQDADQTPIPLHGKSPLTPRWKKEGVGTREVAGSRMTGQRATVSARDADVVAASA